MDINYLSVSDINHYLKNKFDTDEHLQRVYLKGEISNFKNHTVGHLYFTLKDDTSRINAVMFSFNAKSLKFVPEDGMKVLVVGKINVYEANGNYQIYIEKMENDGLGNLYQAYEQLKIKLDNLGYFSQNHKIAIPKYPKKIGIITASTGAAVRDIISTIKRRYPICETILFPTLVQGEGAKENIVKQIKIADNYGVDIIILGRGGGSIEDLWAFNEEIVAKAVYECLTPIISAVGHEIDFTICDFVADLRAPTPTGAAEMAVPNIIEIKNYIQQLIIRLNENTQKSIEYRKQIIKHLKDSYVLKNPMAIYEIKTEKINGLIDRLNSSINDVIKTNKHEYNIVISSYILNNPVKLFDNAKRKQELLINKLELLNPLSILKKGYSVVKKNNQVVNTIDDLKKDDILNITLYNGKVITKVEGVDK